jgi:predicted ATPase/class 3 adenylate cyclase
MDTQLPSGTVTFLFTDIEGSTPLWEKIPEEMHIAVAQHHAILRRAIESNGGRVFQIVGDAFQAAFSHSRQGLCAAIKAQQGLLQAEWGLAGPIRVRMGIHTGSVELDENGDAPYTPNHTLNRASRVMSAGHGGQILISQEVAELTRRDLPADVTLRDLGEHRLKGLSYPEHLYQVLAPDLPMDFPALHSLDNLSDNLPVQLTSFIGREKEIAELRRLLTTTSARLVTLSGPGGTGKTRLGLQVAAESFSSFADGVFFIPLASISDPTLVPSAIASALGVRENPGQPLIYTLAEHLSRKHMLIILDNFEQVNDAAPLISELLSSATNLRILVTSRVILHIYGEYDFPVSPLGLPNLLHLPPLEQLTQYEAVQLFILRAKAAKPGFNFTSANAHAIAEICCRVDGLPLAIELAAARVRILTPDALLSRLINRLQLLTGGAHNLPTRQQTLRNTISWSYDMLDQNEQNLFARLSVFKSGCTLDAAEMVCRDESNPSFSLIDGLEALVDKSLLKQEEATGTGRFIMLDTIQEYAAEELSEMGKADQTKLLHANFYFKLVKDIRPFLEKSEQAVWYERLEHENANLSSAFQWIIENEPVKVDTQLIEALCLFWFIRGHLTEGRKLLAELLKLPSVSDNLPLYANLLNRAGVLARYQGDYESASTLVNDSLVICRQLDDRQLTADVMANLGFIVLQKTDFAQARELYTQAITTYRQIDNLQGIADSLSHLALIAFYEDNYTTARSFDEESLKIWRSLEDQQGIAWALQRLGNVVFHQGDYQAAYAYFRESMLISTELGFKWGIVYAIEGFASLAVAQGQAEYGLQLAGAASVIRQEVGIPHFAAAKTKYEAALLPARRTLGTDASIDAWEKGQTMELAELVNSVSIT